MDEETLLKARLISNMLCRIVDYHAIVRSAPWPGFKSEREACETAVRVAVENLIDGGALE